MAKVHRKTGSKCIVCDSGICPDISVVIHKTRRQTHAMCLDCLQGYLEKPIRQIITNLRRNMRQGVQYISCPGTYRSKISNHCRKKVDITSLRIPEENPLYMEIFRINYVLNSPTAYICPNDSCGSVVDIDQDYDSNSSKCFYCRTTWCRQCLVTPYHEGETCLQHEIKEQEGENAQYIQKLNKEGKVKFCPGCFAPILRSGGCNKMLCQSCGTKWCWICRKTNIDYSHFNYRSSSRCAGRLWEGTR